MCQPKNSAYLATYFILKWCQSYHHSIFRCYSIFADADYTRGNITVSVQVGALTQPLVVNITDDDIVECNETFNVIIESFITYGFTIGNVNRSEVIIIDDDCEHYIIIVIVMHVATCVRS